MAVLTQDSVVSTARFKIHNPKMYEVLPVTCKITGQYRRLLVVGCYMPPGLRADEAKECMDLIVDTIHEAKRKLDQPMVLVAGDFNQFPVADRLKEHGDLKEVKAGPTRGSKNIDKIFLNYGFTEAGVITALQPDPGTGASDSDHRVVFATSV